MLFPLPGSSSPRTSPGCLLTTQHSAQVPPPKWASLPILSLVAHDSISAPLCHFTLSYFTDNIYYKILLLGCVVIVYLTLQNGSSLKASSVLSITVSLSPRTVAHEKDSIHICQMSHWLSDPPSASESLSLPPDTPVFLSSRGTATWVLGARTERAATVPTHRSSDAQQ